MRSIQLYATGAATATSAAQVTIPTAATIRGAQICAIVDGSTDNATCRWELSKVPTNQIGVNGAVDPFLELGIFANTGAAGFDTNGINQFFPLDVGCRQGEIIYLHVTLTNFTYYFTAILYY